MKAISKIIATVLFLLISDNVLSQAKITFNINLKPQLEDSVFIPGRDQVYLSGNTYPLRSTRPLVMKDTEPVDSVYTVEVNFNSNELNTLLEYNFVLVVNSIRMQEDLPRNVEIRGTETLDAMYFNTFAW